MLAVACRVNEYGLNKQRLTFTGANKTEIVRAVCRIDFDPCASVADAEGVGYALADCSCELLARCALVLIINLRACAARSVEVDFYRKVIAVLVDVCYSVRQIKCSVVVDNISLAVIALEQFADVLAYLARYFKLLIVSAERAAVIAAFC